jgi:LUC7 N_terminus
MYSALTVGSCSFRHHEESLKRAFDQKASPREHENYERDLMDYLQYLVHDLDRKTRRAEERLQAKPVEAIVEPPIDPTLKDELEEKIILHHVQAENIIDQIENAAARGDVLHAVMLMDQELDLELDAHRKAINHLNPYKSQEKEMQVCNVCGSFLVVNDDSKRLETHFEGRQHTGYQKVRDELARLQVFPPFLKTCLTLTLCCRLNMASVPQEVRLLGLIDAR